MLREEQMRRLADKSIAVLPFTNMSDDPDQEYFSDGLTDDILTQLAKIEDFRVISRTSVMQYKDNPPPTAGDRQEAKCWPDTGGKCSKIR